MWHVFCSPTPPHPTPPHPSPHRASLQKFAKEKEKERLAAEAAAAVPVPPTLQQRLGAALVASGAALPDEASSSALAVLPVESTAGKSRAVSGAFVVGQGVSSHQLLDAG